MGNEGGFWEVEHTADVALRVTGSDIGEFLTNAAAGLASLLVERPEVVLLAEARRIEIEAPDLESLLVGWLEELLYWAEKEMLIWSNVSVLEATSVHVAAEARGGRVQRLERHIKGVTFHNLRVVETESGLEATVVFDV